MDDFQGNQACVIEANIERMINIVSNKKFIIFLGKVVCQNYCTNLSFQLNFSNSLSVLVWMNTGLIG